MLEVRPHTAGMTFAQVFTTQRRRLIADLVRGLDTADKATRRLDRVDAIELVESSLGPQNATLWNAMRPESYAHANGFYKISYPEVPGSPARVRLHVWPGKESETSMSAPDAHNHIWPFASRVLVGGLIHNILRAESGRGEHYHYEHMRAGDGYRFIRAGRATLNMAAAEVTSLGAVYSMDPRIIHIVESRETNYAATLVIELAPVREFTDVYVARGRKPEGVTVVPRRLGVDEIGQVLADLVKVMKHERARREPGRGLAIVTRGNW